MDQQPKREKKAHPKESANILSLLTFFYTLKLFKKGYKKDLDEDDLYEVLSTCSSKKLGDQLEDQWELDKKIHGEQSLVRVLWTCYGKTYMIFGTIELVMKTVMVLATPEAVGKLISYFVPGQTKLTKTDACYYAAVVIGLNVVHFVYMQNFMMALTEFSVKIRTAICSLIYRRLLKMSARAQGEVSMGRIITLITKDVHAVEMIVLFGNDIWVGFVQTGVICFLIYRKVGVATFVGIGFFLLVLVVQMLIGRMATSYRLHTAKKTDERLQTTQEALSAIKIIKMYTWERFFDQRISAARRKEINSIHKLFYMKVTILLLGGLSTKIAFYLMVMSYVWMGNTIDAEIIYYVMACFGKLHHLLAMLLPLGVAFIAELHATLIRIVSVITAEQAPSSPNHSTSSSEVKVAPRILLDNVSVAVSKTRDATLKNVSLDLQKSGLHAIAGHVGCGKSTLLKAILQTCFEAKTGTIKVIGGISYASQEPWLFPSTVRNNILFGEEFCESRYKEVLRICCLDHDLRSFTFGDRTIVGDRGINLSKGQQCRINLARAIYRRSDIYLLDDCLASLDSNVGDSVFRGAIKEFLSDKLCLFVSNNFDHIKQADTIITIDDTGYLSSKKKLPVEETSGYHHSADEKEEKEKVVLLPEEGKTEQENKEPETEQESTSTNLYTETKKAGKVELSTYRKFASYGGGYIAFFLIFLLYVLAQGTSSYSDKLVSHWVTLQQNLSSLQEKNATNTTYTAAISGKISWTLTLYSALVCCFAVLVLVRSLAFFGFIRRASIRLHQVMLAAMLNAQMAFFDTHFVGNVLNRFSKDLGNIDESLPFVIHDCLDLFFHLGGIIFLVSSVNALFLIPAAVFAVLALIVRHVYQRTGRSLQRLDASTRSPLIGHLNSTLEGLTTIRAFGAQDMIRDEFDRHQDLYTSANYTLQNTSRALAFALESMSSMFIAVVIIRFLVMPVDTSVGNVGLAISQAFHLTGRLQYGIRRWADFENQMTSVERALEYTEVSQESRAGNAAQSWPATGKIRFENVSLSYGEGGRPVLKQISFEADPGKKLGIVGRTGAGKSSIVSVLFRLYDVTGAVTVDGVDIHSLPIKQVRSAISIIPQDPILFSGTVRENIDPGRKVPDERIWRIIRTVKLGDVITDLSARVESGGGGVNSSLDLSAGQKQQVCLARALAGDNRIVVLDEATANMDEETDRLVRDVIRDNFVKATVIVIAHRLSSVLACDSVMVVDDGRIVEHGQVAGFLQDRNSILHEMVKKDQ